MTKERLNVRDLCLIGIFTAIIVVLGQIAIPMPYGIPITLQTFAVLLTGIALGAKRGSLATLCYVLLGALGVPVFSGFAGGFGILFSKSGGFIISFPLMALAAGIGAKSGKLVWMVLGLVMGTVVNYICGMVMFSLITDNSLQIAFFACVLPFIPTAIIKVVLAGVLGVSVKKVLAKGKILI